MKTLQICERCACALLPYVIWFPLPTLVPILQADDQLSKEDILWGKESEFIEYRYVLTLHVEINKREITTWRVYNHKCNNKNKWNMVISSLSYATTHHHAVSKHGKREESLASTPAQQLGPEQPLPNPHSSLPTTSSSFSSFFFFALFK